MKEIGVWKFVVIIVIVSLPIILFAQTERWVYRYNGPGNGYDRVYSLVYGSDGNIYVAGYSTGSGFDIDFTVISLTSSGDTNWIYRYNGTGNDNDGARSIVYGSDGNIYVAGESYGSGTYPDFTVISLTSSGDTNWVYRYNGPGNDNDHANSIVYGSDGNIYVAGQSYGSGTYSDFTVISLTSSGDTNWVYRYNGPGNSSDQAYSIVYGSDGNLYVAGQSDGSGTSDDFTVISLTSSGDTNWVYRYNGPGNSSDKAYSIIYGSDGNLYVAGESYGSGTSDDFTVISLTPQGTENWVYTYIGHGNSSDHAYSIVYGSDGNIYVAGYSYGFSIDFTVISLTPQGTENWVYTYNGPGNDNDGAYSIVYGSDGNIYVAGESYGFSVDFTVISLTPQGTQRWVYRYNGPENGSDRAYSIVYGSDGNLYVAGESDGSGTYSDFTVISLNPATGIEEPSFTATPEPNLNISPNPFATSTTISFTRKGQRAKGMGLRIYDVSGRLIKSIHLTTNHMSLGTKLKPGIYFLKLTTGASTETKKLIKIR